jgi:hypothetical protein
MRSRATDTDITVPHPEIITPDSPPRTIKIQNQNDGFNIIIKDPAICYRAVFRRSQNPGAQCGITSRILAPSYLRTSKRTSYFSSETCCPWSPGTIMQSPNQAKPEHQECECAPSADTVE